MIIGIPKETLPGERRVALTPDAAAKLVKGGVTVRLEKGAGTSAGFPDSAYAAVGVAVVERADAWAADIVTKVQRPLANAGADELQMLKAGSVLVGLLQPLTQAALMRQIAERQVTAFALEVLPRITRAQSMDVLSSMATVAGYRAVLLAAQATGRFFPMLVTAAGTIPPARVLVLGAGVAGLQAIATARRLGAVVEAFDVRAAVKEQVESLGATFIQADVRAEGEGGYAKELSKDQHEQELALIRAHLKTTDAVICTAQIPGRKAPELITADMVKELKPGSVIIDLAAESGGNCAATVPGQDVTRDGVVIVGPLNVAASMPTHASQMYARNVASFLALIVKEGKLNLDFADQIVKETCITRDGQVVHEATKKAAGAA
ncbi:MAG TPA: Re/Si-specific NAD(P)(+) transhydrogenase subunit alpha [Gemmatimonadales bacterium]